MKSREDIIRKRNQDLAAENDELKAQLLSIQDKLDAIARSDNREDIKQKIDELEKLRVEWSLSIQELNQQKEKYDNLINDLKIIKDIMTRRGFKVPWFQKFFETIQKK